MYVYVCNIYIYSTYTVVGHIHNYKLNITQRI
jgi:hypothetical protein